MKLLKTSGPIIPARKISSLMKMNINDCLDCLENNLKILKKPLSELSGFFIKESVSDFIVNLTKSAGTIYAANSVILNFEI